MTDKESMPDPEEEKEEEEQAATELIETFGEGEDARTAEMPAASHEEDTPEASEPTEAEAEPEEEAEAEPQPKKDPKAGWVTAAMPKAQPPANAPAADPAPVAESKPSSPAPKVEPAPLSSAAAALPAASEGAPKEGPSSIAFMENLGVESPQTQRIILGVTGGVVFLCCGCSCLIGALTLFSG